MSRFKRGVLIVGNRVPNVWRLVEPDNGDLEDSVWVCDRLFSVGKFETNPVRELVNIVGCVMLDALRVGLMYQQVTLLKRELDRSMAE